MARSVVACCSNDSFSRCTVSVRFRRASASIFCPLGHGGSDLGCSGGLTFAFACAQPGHFLLEPGPVLVVRSGKLLIEFRDLLLQTGRQAFRGLHVLGGDLPDALELENGILQMFGGSDEPLELFVQFVPQGSRGVCLVADIIDDEGV